MIAALNVLTPTGPKLVNIAFADSRDEVSMRAWRTSAQHSRADLAADSLA
jgi:hypothetical protein